MHYIRNTLFRPNLRFVWLLGILLVLVSFHASAHDAVHHQNDQYRLSRHAYQIPDVVLVDINGQPVSLLKELDASSPVMLNFIFISCSSVCPVATATFSQMQQKLSQTNQNFKMISISIDPEHDTPDKLKEYSRRFNTGDHWQFLTGDLTTIIAIQRAFDAYRGNKMNHEPLTFIKPSGDKSWYRIEGFTSASVLLAELDRLNAFP